MARALSPIAGAAKRLDVSWRVALLNWVGARLGLGLWAAWIWFQGLMPVSAGSFYFTIAPLVDGWQGAVIGMWQRWDSILYQTITEQFYAAPNLTVFFPGYPLLARFVAGLTGMSALAALLLVSTLAALFSMVMLHRIAMDLLPLESANRTILCAVLFPTAFFFFGAYPQSLALLWILIAYDQARRDRWLAAGLAGLLAGLTHATAAALAVMLAVQVIQYYERRGCIRFISPLPKITFGKISPGMLAVGLVPVMPLLGMGIFLGWRVVMGFPSFTYIQDNVWDRVVSPPWSTLWALIQYFPANVGRNWVIVLNTVMLGAAIFAVVWGLKRLPLALSIYQATLLVYLLSNRVTTDPLLSFNRYILLMFPLFMALGSLPTGHKGRIGQFAFSVLALLGLSGMFFMWKWIA